jgi:hypothetical protein
MPKSSVRTLLLTMLALAPATVGAQQVQFPAAAALVVWWTAEYPTVRDAFCE